MVRVVHVDDTLAPAKDQATMDRFAAELGQKSKMKGMGDSGYYDMGCHITRNRKARELKLDQHVYVEYMVKKVKSKMQLKYRLRRGCQRSQRRTNRGTQRRRRKCGSSLHGSMHGLGFQSLPRYETIDFGCGVDAGEGGDQLALKDARSDSIGYLGGRVRCFIRGGK